MKKATLVGPVPGMIKQVPLGFSWTTLFFGGFVALFRKDWKWAGILIGATVIVNVISSQLNFNFGGMLVGIVAGFFYNSIYVKELMENGWKPASDLDAQAIAQASRL